MRGRLLAIVSTISMVACVSTLLLWIGSYVLPRCCSLVWGGDTYLVTLNNGQTRICKFSMQCRAIDAWLAAQPDRFDKYRKSPGPTPLPIDGCIAIPIAVPTGAFGLFPLFYLPRLLRGRRRRARGFCPGCGYDLRASNAHCPECGWAIGAGKGAGGCSAK